MIVQIVVLFIAALLGGALNSVAGGGSFLTFPALIVSGVPPIKANATSTVALWPGAVASVGAYRRELGAARHRIILSVVSLIGGVIGAILLLHTPSDIFERLIPYLLLAATILFAFGPRITAWVRAHMGGTGESGGSGGSSARTLAAIIVLQLIIALYGGFFGGGIGILMLATLGLMGIDNIHEANALKTLLAACINGIAVLTFIIARAVYWPQAMLMVAGAVIGGYAGAAFARRLDPTLVRRFVILVGLVMTAYFFIHG